MNNKLWILLLSFALQACTNAALSGAQVVYSRQTIKESLNDQLATMQSYRKLYLDSSEFKNSNVSVATFNHIMLLAGQAESEGQKDRIEDLVRKTSGITEIHNLITISPPSPPLTRVSDAWITTKIRAKLIAANDVDPSQIKVITEDGTVYLMGIVRPEQADIAIDIARTTDGVQNVVKVFQYLKIVKT